MASFLVQSPDGGSFHVEAAAPEAAAQALEEMADASAGQRPNPFADLIPGRTEAPPPSRAAPQPSTAAPPPSAGPADQKNPFPELMPSQDTLGDRFATAFDEGQDDPRGTLAPTTAAMGDRFDRGSIIDPLSQGLTMGYGDEILGTIMGGLTWAAGGGFDKGYNAITESARADLEAYRQRNPVTATAAEVVGAIPSALVPGGAAVRGASLGGKMLRGAAAGAGYGAVTGFGSGEGGVENRLESAGTGTAVGGTVGAAAPLVGRAVSSVVGRRAANRAAPTVESVKTDATALYDTARKAGVAVKTPALQRASSIIKRRMVDEGIDDAIHPKASAALRRVEAMGSAQKAGWGPAALGETETVRKVIVQATKSPEAADRYMAGRLLDEFDTWRTGLKPADMIAGQISGREAIGMLGRAQQLWKRQAKGDVLADLVERAQLAKGDFGDALRNEFRTLARNKNRMRQFTKQETAAIRRVVRGGPIDWILRGMGVAAPSNDAMGMIRGGIGSAAGVLGGGPVGGIVVPVAAYGAKKLAGRSTRRAVDRASRMALSGGQPLPMRSTSYGDRLFGTGGLATESGLD